MPLAMTTTSSFMESADCHLKRTAAGDLRKKAGEDRELVEEIKQRMILHWNYRNLSEFPPELLNHGEDVKEIYLKRNSLIKLPQEVGRLKGLTNIYLSGNKLRTLSAEIGELEKLEVLDVSQNYLECLPSSVGKLARLQQLVLTSNQLICLPKELKQLKRLKFLEASENQLKSLDPDIFQGLTELEELCVDRNPLKYLPRNLTDLPKLRSVSVCKCDLRFLPARPFSFAVSCHYRRRNGQRGSRRNPAGLGEVEEPTFQFRFDGNPNLNYIPYWAIRLLGPLLESYGCNRPSHNSESNNSLPVISFSSVPDTHFACDKCLRSIRQDKKMPTLLELALRYLHINRDFSTPVDMEWNIELPGHLAQLLIIGPVSQCFQCMGPIFTEYWPLFFKLQTEAGPMEISEMLYPHGMINAYNNFQMNQPAENGLFHGFNFSYLSFCSSGCKEIFTRIVGSSEHYRFHDYNLILQNQLSNDL